MKKMIVSSLLAIIASVCYAQEESRVYTFDEVDDVFDAVSARITVNHTPQPVFTKGIKNSDISLNGTWLFHPNPPAGFEKGMPEKGKGGWVAMAVPSEWYMHSYKVEEGAYAGYFRTMEIPADWNKQRVILRFGAVNSACLVYINGELAGEHMGCMTSFEFDITPHLKKGKNTLALYVKSESVAENISRISHYAKHQVGGMLRGVKLMIVPEVYFAAFHCTALLSDDLKKGSLDLSFDVGNRTSPDWNEKEVEVILRKKGIEGLLDEKEEVMRQRIKISPAHSSYRHRMELDNPELWHAESPYLYTVEMHLYEKGSLLETVTKQIGFKKIDIKGNVLYVNNQPLKLHGVARHDIHPYDGRALPDTALLRRDIELFRNANCNYIRTVHYPPDEYLLDLCDRYGLFVENEAPVCWNGNTEESKEIAELTFYAFKSLLFRDRSHPCVLVWSLANESKWSPKFELCRRLVKQETPHIPVKFSHSEYYGINPAADVGSRHYPGWEGLMKYDNYFRPIIFSEALHLNSYNTSENITDPGLRDMWGDYVKYFLDQITHAPAITGLGIWSAIDEMFYPKGQAPVGYGPWGVVDGFRREKPEFWHMKMAFSPVQVVSPHFYVVENKTWVVLENRYNTLNLNTLDVRWRDGAVSGKVTVEGVAGKQTMLSIPHAMQGDELLLDFQDKRGFSISQWSIPREHPRYTMPPMEVKKKLHYAENGQILKVNVQDLAYTFSVAQGKLISVKKGKEVLLDGEVQFYLIPLLKSNEVIDFIPQDPIDKTVKFTSDPLAEWECHSVTTHLTDSLVRLVCKGTHGDIPLTYTYTMNGDGQMRVDYIANITKVDYEIRQIGVGFNAPPAFDVLTWKRDALWGFYPADHIGRKEGTANAFYPETLDDYWRKRTIPTHSYAREGNSHGSTDFRSTKQQIVEASLSDSQQNVIRIESNGKQAFRSWITDKGTSFLVANYSNAGNEHYLSFDSNRTRYTTELRLDGNDIAGWIQLRFGNY